MTMLGVKEASNRLGIHPNTLRRWADMGIIKYRRITSRGDRRFIDTDIDNFGRGGADVSTNTPYNHQNKRDTPERRQPYQTPTVTPVTKEKAIEILKERDRELKRHHNSC